jgi:uncharacterized membrane protein
MRVISIANDDICYQDGGDSYIRGRTLLQSAIIARNGRSSALATAVGSDFKGKLSLAMYIAAVPLAFVKEWIAIVIYIAVALLWLVPDRRIELTSDRS